ncbi:MULTISPECIES: helix-hairpin-helix domain-containing protein [Halobacterium]|uniref:helix-hairpin-helix domain-containing protein n=1 Tax=Halobacterium TaxID=2239 RepID=UPI00073E54F8|nr:MULTISPECIES: helix-hairpin-helix domain-containing protein [Halobacterium]MCG1002367.1 helix-hairpin-helix domain-containing protein [Halobacterium noricense]
MGLLSTLKSLLGMEEESRSAGSGVDVTVEHEPSTESERAVKESDAETGDEDDVDETVATETDAAASTESLVDEEHTDDSTRAAEPAEAAGTGDEEVPETAEDGVDEAVASETDAAASTESLVDEDHTDDPTRAAEPAEAASTGDDEDATESVDGESVTVLKGIGPAYADRLEEAGVHTVADLAAADPEEIAERIDLSAKRVGRWVDAAQNHD